MITIIIVLFLPLVHNNNNNNEIVGTIINNNRADKKKYKQYNRFEQIVIVKLITDREDQPGPSSNQTLLNFCLETHRHRL